MAKKVVIIGGRAFRGGRAIGFRRGERRRARLRRTASGGFQIVVETPEEAKRIEEQLRIEKEEVAKRETEAERKKGLIRTKEERQEVLEERAVPKVIVGTKGTRRIIFPIGFAKKLPEDVTGQRRGRFTTVVGEELIIGEGKEVKRIKAEEEGQLVGITVIKSKPVPSEKIVTFEKPPLELKAGEEAVKEAFPPPTIIEGRTPLEIVRGTGISERASFELERARGKLVAEKRELKGKEDFISGIKVSGLTAAQFGLGIGAVGLGTLQFISAPIKSTKEIVTHSREIGLEFGERLRTQPAFAAGEAITIFFGGKLIKKGIGTFKIRKLTKVKPPAITEVKAPEISLAKKVTVPSRVKVSTSKAVVGFKLPKELGKVVGIETVGQATRLGTKEFGKKVVVDIEAISKVQLEGAKKPIFIGAKGQTEIGVKKFGGFTPAETKLQTRILGEKGARLFDIKSLARKQKIGLMEDIPPFLKAGIHRGVVTFVMVKSQRLPIMFSGAFAKQIGRTPKGKIFFQAGRAKAFAGQEISPLEAKIKFFEAPIIDEKTIFRIRKPKIETPDISDADELLLKRKGVSTLERQLGFQVSETAKISAEQAFVKFRAEFPPTKTPKDIVSGAVLVERVTPVKAPLIFAEEIVEPLAIKRFKSPITKVKAVPRMASALRIKPVPTISQTRLERLAQVQGIQSLFTIKFKTIQDLRLRGLQRTGLMEQFRFGIEELTRRQAKQTFDFITPTTFTIPAFVPLKGFAPPPILLPPRGGALRKGKKLKQIRSPKRMFKPDIFAIAFGIKGRPDIKGIFTGLGGGLRPIPTQIFRRKR